AATFRADLADLSATSALVPQVVERLGRLDILVNNASVFEAMTLDGFDVAAWERTLRINLSAPMVLAHAARDELIRRGGRVVNICDVVASRPSPSKLAYYVSKGGLETLTRVLARGLAPNVNVVGIAPSVADWPDDYSADQKAQVLKSIPLG